MSLSSVGSQSLLHTSMIMMRMMKYKSYRVISIMIKYDSSVTLRQDFPTDSKIQSFFSSIIIKYDPSVYRGRNSEPSS